MSRVEPEEALDELAENILGRINVALPGVVVSYDEATNSCSVRPAVRGHYIDEDTEERIAVRPPVIPRVPVAMPRFGDQFEIDAPLIAGDHVLLLFCDRSIDEYVQTGRADNIPQDVRRFDFTDAVALPLLLRPRSAAATARVVVGLDGTITVEGSSIKLGAGASEAVLKGDEFLSALYTAFDAHVHVETGATTAIPSVLWTATDPLGATKSNKVTTE